MSDTTDSIPPEDYDYDGQNIEDAYERSQDHTTRAESDWAERGPNGIPEYGTEAYWLMYGGPDNYSDDPPSQISEVAPIGLNCEIVFGMCLTHECPSWQCSER